MNEAAVRVRDEERYQSIRTMIEDGRTVREMADVLGITRQAIYKFCDQHSLRRPDQKQGGTIGKKDLVELSKRKITKPAAARQLGMPTGEFAALLADHGVEWPDVVPRREGRPVAAKTRKADRACKRRSQAWVDEVRSRSGSSGKPPESTSPLCTAMRLNWHLRTGEPRWPEAQPSTRGRFLRVPAEMNCGRSLPATCRSSSARAGYRRR